MKFSLNSVCLENVFTFKLDFFLNRITTISRSSLMIYFLIIYVNVYYVKVLLIIVLAYPLMRRTPTHCPQVARAEVQETSPGT